MESKKTNIRFNIMIVILIIIFCFAISPITLQNDTFYTIKIGEHIINNGIDMKDPFSFHNLSYTYPHWAYDVGIYLIYNVGGQVGIYLSTIVLCSILGILMYFVNTKLTKNNIVSFIITIGSLYLLQDFIAARAQLVTFILFLLTVYFIEKFLETAKKRYIVGLIIIPIIIANVHVAVFPFYFVLYLPYIGEYMIYILSNAGIVVNENKIKNLKKKLENNNKQEEVTIINEQIVKLEERIKVLKSRREKSDKNAYKIKINVSKNINYLIIIMIICLFAGLLTPIGDTPYTYLIKTMKGNTTQNINEHLPLTLINNPKLMVYMLLFIVILTFTDTKIKLSDFFMLSGLMVLTFYTKRQQSILILIGGIILSKLISSMFEKYDPTACENLKKRITQITGMIITISLMLAFSINLYKPKMNDKFVDEKNYPTKAAEWIKDNLDINNIRLYNEYNYGSYLLFKGIPVFIDSRADLYAPEFNAGVNVFSDFLTLSGVNNDKIEEILDKYGITHLIMRNNTRLRTFIKQNEEKYNELYEDEYFCIYERKQIQ